MCWSKEVENIAWINNNNNFNYFCRVLEIVMWFQMDG